MKPQNTHDYCRRSPAFGAASAELRGPRAPQNLGILPIVSWDPYDALELQNPSSSYNNGNLPP